MRGKTTAFVTSHACLACVTSWKEKSARRRQDQVDSAGHAPCRDVAGCADILLGQPRQMAFHTDRDRLENFGQTKREAVDPSPALSVLSQGPLAALPCRETAREVRRCPEGYGEAKRVHHCVARALGKIGWHRVRRIAQYRDPAG